MDYAGNYVRFLADHMVASLRKSGTLSQYKQATEVDFEDGYAQGGSSFSFQDGPLKASGLTGKYKYRNGNFGTVSVVSGVDGISRKPKKYVSSIPQNFTFEVANIRDCKNVAALARSVNRGGGFDPRTSPLDPTDPLDVAAEDIAHGLVEYYESYTPGFKDKACANIASSASRGWTVAWCGNGGGGGGPVPDIDGVMLDPASVELAVGDSTTATLTFSNAGDASLDYSVSSDLSQVTVSSSASGSVGPGATASVGLTYTCKPDEPGKFEGLVTISSNNASEVRASASVTINCIAPVVSIPPLQDPYITAINYIGLPNRTSNVLPNTFDFRESGEKLPLEFWLELPEWLDLAPVSGKLSPGESYAVLAATKTQSIHCGDPGEKEGQIVVHTNDPVHPRISIPVRLICPRLEVSFSPDTYDGLTCPPLTGRIQILNAPHLIELYTDVVLDDNGEIVEVTHREPQFIYYPKNTPHYRLKRWPILYGQEGEGSTWSWDQYPMLPFGSWMNSCGYAAMGDSEHIVEEFYLLHPRRNDNNERLLYPFVADLQYPTAFYTPNPYPGVIVNTTMYRANGSFSIGSFPRQSYSLLPSESIWARFSFGMHGEKIKYYNEKGQEKASFYTPGTGTILSWGDLWGCRFHPDIIDSRESYWEHEIPLGGGPFRIVSRTCYPSLKLVHYSYYEAPWHRGETPVEEEPVEWDY